VYGAARHYRSTCSATKGLVLDANATLLRGCVLKNVDAAFGFVIYTGRETKVRVKQSAVMSKKASIEAEINQYIVALISLQLVLCAIGAIGYFIWTRNYGPDSFYLDTGVPTAGDSITRFFTFFLLISNIIPISLYVTMKLARTAQKFFMDNDDRCVYRDEELLEKTNGEEGIFPLVVRAMDLNDELGQISHIFSDKTGTLTSNYMEFRKLTVNGACSSHHHAHPVK
jgi:phospholipid-transporting ATPase